MGAWGIEILANDQSLDAYEHYVKLLSQGLSPEEAKSKLFQHEAKDRLPAIYDKTLFWFGLAQAQLDTNNVDQQVLEIIEKIVIEKIDLEEYWTLKPGLYEKRKKAQEEFYKKLKKSILDSEKQ